MGIELGTRGQATQHKERIQQGSQTRGYTRDIGMTKNVTASLTFAAGASQIQGVGSAAFAVNDPVLVEKTNLNNGYFIVTANDGTNLTVDPPPKDEGPISATVRTP